jgi:protein SCO1/2
VQTTRSCKKNTPQGTRYPMVSMALVLILAVLFPLHAHGDSHAAPHDTTPRNDATYAPGDTITDRLKGISLTPSPVMGIEEKLGTVLPLDLPFVTESGDSIRLGDIIKEPTILSILYYKCPNACNLLLTSIADVVRSYATKPTAPTIICITVDETETPADARRAKAIAYQALQNNYPPEKWHFLTGSAESIRAVTDATGFHFVKRGDDFDHPLGIVILSPAGKVVRYIMGTDYLPMDVSMSLMEAAAGTLQPTIARVLRACFSYDPQSHRFVFRILQVSATVIFSLIGGFILFLILSGRKRRPRGDGNDRS